MTSRIEDSRLSGLTSIVCLVGGVMLQRAYCPIVPNDSHPHLDCGNGIIQRFGKE